MSQEYIEATGKTLQDAITAACVQLSVTSQNLDYEVIDQGSRGFLGFNARPARIKARPKSASDAAEAILSDVLTKAEKRVQEKKEAAAPAKEERKAAAKPAEKKTERKPEKKAEEKAVKPAPAETAAEAPAEAAQPAEEAAPVQKPEKKEGGRRNRNRNRRKKNADKQAAPAAETRQSAEQPRKESKKKADAPVLTEDQISVIQDKAQTFLRDVFAAMNLKVDVSTTYDQEDGTLTVNMEGDDMGMLIGKRGQTLDSLQYLVSLVINKGIDGYIHVKADTENYRERRKQTLENLARNIASKVKRGRKPVTLEPMNPYERRIIHSALQSDRFVTTYSEGEEPFRRVVVALKKQPRGIGGGRRFEYRDRGERKPQAPVQEAPAEKPAPAPAETPADPQE